MKKRERAGKGDRGGARKSEAQTAHFIRDMEEQTPFAYAFVKSQNRNMYRRMMQYKRELDAERSARAGAERELRARADCLGAMDRSWAAVEVDLVATLRALGVADAACGDLLSATAAGGVALAALPAPPPPTPGDDDDAEAASREAASAAASLLDARAKRCADACRGVEAAWRAAAARAPGDAGAVEAAVRDADQRRAAAEHAAGLARGRAVQLESAVIDLKKQRDAAQKRADLAEREHKITPYPEKLAAAAAPAPEPDAKRARTEAAAAPPAAPAAGGAAAEEAARLRARVADLEEQVSGAFETRIQLKMAVDAGVQAFSALESSKAMEVAEARHACLAEHANGRDLKAALSDAEARATRFAGDRDANKADRDAAAGDADRSRARVAVAEALGRGAARDALGEWAEKLEATAAARRSAEEARDAAAARADAAALAADGLRKALEVERARADETVALNGGLEAQLEAAARREAIVAAPPPEEGEVDDDQATAGATNEGLRDALKRTEEVNRSLLEEVDATATTFTDLRDQNKRLLDRAGALDACYRATLSDVAAARSAAKREVAARDALKAKVDHTEYVVNEMKQLLNARSTVAEDLEREHGLAVANAAAATSEVGHLKGQLAAARLEQDAAARDLDVARGQLKRFHEDLSAKLADETTAKARVQDQLKAMERKHTKLEGQLSRSVDDLRKEKHRNGAGTDETTRSMIRDLREKIACNVCNDREKTTCLTRCMHVFCRECVDQVIETRSRKCPACHKPFGASDVKEIYFCA